MIRHLILGAALLGVALPTEAEIARSKSARAAFVRAHPCPVTGKRFGACPGWVVDHIEPLCAGGADVPANMQWQPIPESRAKDQLEWAQCRRLRAGTR